MIYVWYFFAFLQTLLAIESLRGGFAFRNYFRRELSKPPGDYAPPVSIIAPCKGIDDGLRENLQALFDFDYPNYEIVFAVDSPDDAAVKTIKDLIAANAKKARLVVAKKAEGESRKIGNMRAAVKAADAETEVFVFVDSDARPAKDRLKYLVAPLANKNVGAASGYRWFIHREGNFPTHLRSAWNASIVSILGANGKTNFCWGGATAIRRETFETLGIAEKWRGKLSSDYALTNALKKADSTVYFVPQCLTASIEETDWSEMLEFTTRQMKLTQVYSPERFRVSLVGSLIFTFVFWGGILLLFFQKMFSADFILISSVLLFALITGIWKVLIRIETAKLVLTDYRRKLDEQKITHSVLWLFTPILYIYNNLRALSSKKIKWRGITYIIHSPTQTEILREE